METRKEEANTKEHRDDSAKWPYSAQQLQLSG
jgi:hypothetical protein